MIEVHSCKDCKETPEEIRDLLHKCIGATVETLLELVEAVEKDKKGAFVFNLCCGISSALMYVLGDNSGVDHDVVKKEVFGAITKNLELTIEANEARRAKSGVVTH